jgi:hypothetical protein
MLKALSEIHGEPKMGVHVSDLRVFIVEVISHNLWLAFPRSALVHISTMLFLPLTRQLLAISLPLRTWPLLTANGHCLVAARSAPT